MKLFLSLICSNILQMTFLLPIDYHSIIEFAIDLNEKDIPHYFFNQYQLHNPTNTNFVNNLNEVISDLEQRFEVLIKRNILMREGADEVKKIKKKVDYRKKIDWKNESFYYYNGVLNHDFPIAWNGKEYKRFTINKLDEIKIGFENFTKMIIVTKKIDTPQESKTIKLNWKGQKNQLYQVLRDLKQQELISNSYNQLADFLIQNVIGFNNTSKETIEKELKKNKPLPKNKRVKISTLDKTK